MPFPQAAIFLPLYLLHIAMHICRPEYGNRSDDRCGIDRCGKTASAAPAECISIRFVSPHNTSQFFAAGVSLDRVQATQCDILAGRRSS